MVAAPQERSRGGREAHLAPVWCRTADILWGAPLVLLTAAQRCGRGINDQSSRGNTTPPQPTTSICRRLGNISASLHAQKLPNPSTMPSLPTLFFFLKLGTSDATFPAVEGQVVVSAKSWWERTMGCVSDHCNTRPDPHWTAGCQVAKLELMFVRLTPGTGISQFPAYIQK
jgi:hypothetical protein